MIFLQQLIIVMLHQTVRLWSYIAGQLGEMKYLI